MPAPGPDELQDEFMRRCMSDPEAFSSHPDSAQRYAFCSIQWENRSVETDLNKQLLETIVGRKTGGKFGYGITTADRYVKQVLDVCNEARGVTDPAAVLKRASETLTFCDPAGALEEKRAVADMAVLLPKGVKAPDNTLMVLQHVVTTPREDRDTDVLVTEGAMLDPKAPLLWQHLHTFPIGKVLAEVDHSKEVLRVVTALLDLNEMTEDAAKLIEADVLRFSHGFRALEWEERKDKDGNPIYGFKVTKFEIMEVSLVSVPSNVDAEMELFGAGKLHSPEFKAHAKGLWDARQKSAPGTDLKGEETPPPATPPVEAKSENGGQTGEPDVVPPVQDDSSSKGGHPGSPEADPLPADNPEGEKRGRVLSARNVDALTETISDLEELKTSDGLTRAQKALIGKSISRLKQVLKEASPDDEDDDGKGTEPEPADELTVEEAMAFVLQAGTVDQIDKFASSLSAIQRVRDSEAKGASYRRAVGQSIT